jgi:hypothetical protein
VLDKMFPGGESGGITSNFQGLLSEVILQMAKGRSVLDGLKGYATHLSPLVVDDSMFGQPMVRGDQFLVLTGGDHVLALQPGNREFRPLAEITDAWTSFDVAAQAAFEHCARQGMTIHDIRKSDISVQCVVPVANQERGYLLGNALSAVKEAV